MPSPSGQDIAQLAAVGLQCRRGGRTLVRDVSFEAGRGQLVELRGSNGSGKTTLIRVLAGLAAPSGGTLYWQGAPLARGDTAYARHMAYLGHQNALGAELSATENLRFFQHLQGGPACEPAQALQAWGLAHVAHHAVRRLSQGQRRRLALARVWSRQCGLWLLDEPCAALDDEGARLLDARLAEHLQRGGAAVVATHRPLGVPASVLRTIDLDAEAGAAAC
jgi:heme exporter protein A